MTSFIANTVAFVSDDPEIVSALLSTSSTLMNSSIVPVILSSDDTWLKLCTGPDRVKIQTALLKLFSTFSDTMQFTEQIANLDSQLSDTLVNEILQNLSRKYRYFTRTLKRVAMVSAKNVSLACWINLKNLHAIDLENCARSFHDAHLEQVCDSFPLLEELDLSNMRNITDEGLKHLSKLTSLRKLDINYVGGGRKVTRLPFLKKLKRLSHLNLKSGYCLGETCFRDFDNDDDDVGDKDDSVPALLSLQEIDVSLCAEMTGATFSDLQENAPSLSSLKCSELRSGALEAISKMTKLRRLHILDSVVRSEDAKLLSQNLHLLEELWIKHCPGIDDPSLFHVSQLPNVKHLVLEGCSSVSDGGLRYLSTMKRLEALEISEDSNVNFTGDIISGSSSSLSSELTSSDELSPPFASLRELLISSFPHFNDTGLASVVKSVSSLKTLAISACPKITSKGLKSAFNSSNSIIGKTIQTLEIRGCPEVKDLSFLEGLNVLKKLDVCDSEIMPAEFRNGFELWMKSSTAIASSSCLLEDLNVAGTNIDDSGLSSLPLQVVVNLKRLNLRESRKLTPEVIFETVTRMASLETLDIRIFPGNNISVEDVECIAAKLPRLVSFDANIPGVNKRLKEDPRLMKKLGRLLR